MSKDTMYAPSFVVEYPDGKKIYYYGAEREEAEWSAKECGGTFRELTKKERAEYKA